MLRRFLSLVLLLAFTFPVVAPALTLGQNPDASLPACCRRNGKHHCMMLMARRSSNGPAIGSVCPYFPQPLTTPTLTLQAGLLADARLSAAHLFAFAATQHATTLSRLTRDSVHRKRGPPQHLL